MDPSQAQSDKSNDVHSLENSDGTEDAKSTAPASGDTGKADGKTGDSNVTDATGGRAPEAAPAAPKRSALKRFWDKFNIYLVLFILVVVVAVGILVALTL